MDRPHLIVNARSKVLIVGGGRFGRHLEQLFRDKAPQIDVTVYEPCPRYISDGSFEIRDYDIIILAVPIREYENVIKEVVPRMRDDALLVDVATVKMHTVALLEKYAAERFWVATHPMWGPESYEKTGRDVHGLRLVVTKHSMPKPVFERVYKLIAGTGVEVVKMTPAQHDGHLAQTLFLTHFIGQTIAAAGFNRTEIDTVSFGFLMQAVESVEGDAELFLDVFRHNKPRCSEVLRRMEDAMHQVRLLLEENST